MRKFLTLFCAFSLTLFGCCEVIRKPPVYLAPYGSWESPIQADLITKGSIRLTCPQEFDGNLYFLERRPVEKGRSVLVQIDAAGNKTDLTPPPFNVRTTVHEYGGRSLLIHDKSIYFSNYEDQQIYKIGKTIEPFTHEPDCRFSDGTAFGNRLYYICEKHGKSVENYLVMIDGEGKVTPVAQGSDFYTGPRINADGTLLAYYCWDHPNMPWDGGELRVAKVQKDGSLGETIVVAGGKEESIGSHAWGPDNCLYYTSDRSGFWNLYCNDKPLYPIEAEIGPPQWNLGWQPFVFWDQKIVAVYSKNGIDQLAILDGNEWTPIELPFSTIGSLSIKNNHLYFVASSPCTPSTSFRYHLDSQTLDVVANSTLDPIGCEYLSIPQAIEFPTTNDQTAHAFFYPPKNWRYIGLENELPPLIVLSHGGPTAATSTAYNLEIQYWTSRGIAVVDVNYGGSSGFGRAYRERLKGKWGIVDVDDCTNAALYCVNQGLVDKNRIGISGGSAGGFTTLACLSQKDIFSAGACFYGVSDLEALMLETHKFESRYLDGLIGPYPAAKAIYKERSPIYNVDQIKCPILFLQGSEDKVVPPSQSEKMYNSLLQRGIPTAYLLFENEQHGFRQAANIQRSIEAESFFFSKILGYKLADDIQPIEIQNFEQ